MDNMDKRIIYGYILFIISVIFLSYTENLLLVLGSSVIYVLMLWWGTHRLKYPFKLYHFLIIAFWQPIARSVFELLKKHIIVPILNLLTIESTTQSFELGTLLIILIIQAIVPEILSFIYTYIVNAFLIQKFTWLDSTKSKRLSIVATLLMQACLMVIIAIISLIPAISFAQLSIKFMLIYLVVPVIFIIIAAILFCIAKSNIEKWKVPELIDKVQLSSLKEPNNTIGRNAYLASDKSYVGKIISIDSGNSTCKIKSDFGKEFTKSFEEIYVKKLI